MRRADKVLEEMEWGVMQDCSDYHPRNRISPRHRVRLAARAAREAFEDDDRGMVLAGYAIVGLSCTAVGFVLGWCI